MTCIAGAISKDGRIYIGGDSGCTMDSNCARIDTQPKVFKKGAFLIGTSGGSRSCQILQYCFTPPPFKGDSVEEYMSRYFVPKLRRAMKNEGGENDREMMDGRCLIGYRGRLFEVDSGYGVLSPAFPYHAVGCADQIALGAMHARRRSDAGQMVRAALEASVQFDVNIRPPFTIKSI